MNKPKTIIDAENDHEERHNLKEHFSDQGFIVLEASLGRRLLEIVKQHSVDLILLNYRLPDAVAIDFVKIIRDHTNVPVLITGGHAEMGHGSPA